MAFAENEAVFESRAREIGLEDEIVKSLKDAGLTSMATYEALTNRCWQWSGRSSRDSQIWAKHHGYAGYFMNRTPSGGGFESHC